MLWMVDMIAIVGSRGSHKTTELVKLSALTGIPILSHTVGRARNIRQTAHRLGLSIPEPITPIERCVNGRRKVMIDDLHSILEKELGIDVVCATFDASSFDMSSVTLLELLGMWWRMRKGAK